MNTLQDWEQAERGAAANLAHHARGCAKCYPIVEGRVRVDSDCDHGIILLSEWFLAKQQAILLRMQRAQHVTDAPAPVSQESKS